jgi:integrase
MLQIRGGRLCLRGPLPRKNGQPGLLRQRLSLGLPADEQGLGRALAELAGLERQLAEHRFRWEDWRRPLPRAAAAGGVAPQRVKAPGGLPGADSSPPLRGGTTAQEPLPDRPLAQRLSSFEQAFFADPKRRRRPGSRTTWSAAYLPYLRRLAAHAGNGRPQPFGIALLEEVVESYALASRSRQQCAVALAAVARHQGLDLPSDWSERAGGYGLHAARFRQLPSDAEILNLVDRIPNEGWRLAYGLMATYGLRNHEVFFCDCSALLPGGDRVIRVLPTSKTGEHQVWPFQPAWVEHFGLEQLGQDRRALPPVRTDLGRTTLQQVGRRVAEQFRRYDLPITPYDLRHAWAVRTIHVGLPDTVAARMMGHSVGIHTRTYHHWITRRDQQQAVDAALQRLRAA